ncbi:hypothetical protein GGD46_004337 [Rhizobium lusitanum]|uniref:Uncharacterized protein n=1 Tax=Rhizobium lusitanum TaxID=293958 RepID=A0A7X0IW31_9HYPH|nr:hypothetical protein [Rhizobium lusitanum]
MNGNVFLAHVEQVPVPPLPVVIVVTLKLKRT